MAYISRGKTDYALLINGEWGAGKTFYIKNTLLGKRREEGKLKGYAVLFFSLSGVKTIEELKQKILFGYLKQNKKGKNKPNEDSNELWDTILEFGSRVTIPYGISEIGKLATGKFIDKKLNSIKKDKLLIILDDFERNSIYSEVMGFIHNTFADKSAKVLYIANENKIDTIEEYNEIKEKYIRYTLLFDIPISSLLKNCLEAETEEYKEIEEYKGFISEHLEFVARAFEHAKHRNLRTFLYICDLFMAIYKYISKLKEEYKNIILDKYFTSLLIFSIEQKTGNEQYFDSLLRRFKSNPSGIQENDNANKYLESFTNKYIDLSGLEFNYYSEIVNLLRNGIFNEDEANKTIREIVKIANEKNTLKLDSYNAIINYRKLDENELHDHIRQLLLYVEEGGYEVNNYYQIFYILNEIISKGYYKLKKIEDVMEIIRTGFIKHIETSRREGAEIIADDMYQVIQSMEINKPNAFADELTVLLKSYSKDCSANKRKKNLLDLFTAMEEKDGESFREQYQLIDKKNIFRLLVKNQLLYLLDNMKITVMYWLEVVLNDMLRSSNMSSVYAGEKEYIEKTKEYLMTTRNKEKNDFRKRRLTDLITQFENVLNKL